MFTRVFYESLACNFSNSGPSNILIKNNVGDNQTVPYPQKFGDIGALRSALATFCKVSKSTVFNGGVAFGDGNTPVTVDDYQLSGNHLTAYTPSYDCKINEDLDEITWTYTITNNGTTAFTIKEIGVFISASYNYYNALVLREVLDSPVTIEAGGVGQVTLKIKVNVPT